MADYNDVVSYLGTVPGASPAWAEPLFAAGMTMEAVRSLVQTMSQDNASPLREAEEGVLSREIVRMNSALGVPGDGPGNGRVKVRLRQVLSAAEQARVVRLTGHFCQPQFSPRGKFSKTNHGVMNATRRAISGYNYSRVGRGERVLEVGPDVVNFVLSEDTDRFYGGDRGYLGARPALGPRDVVRMQWDSLLDRVLEGRVRAGSAAVTDKALAVMSGQVMLRQRAEEVNKPVDGILSIDANYDFDFAAMPGVMARTRARWWHGTMCRAKGLTRYSKRDSGRLELSGTTWRVAWKDDRIDFRHPGCASFGYSHRASNYMRYEESNGYVWHAPDASYVYSKGPETNDELLFFSVHRVAGALHLREPTYVEHPQAGKMRLSSVWAVGDEVSGVPQRFDAVTFHVDALNFSKVVEKRRALDHKGDIGVTVNLVRSTNVIFFLNGTAVGASTKIEARLAEATAVVVEVLCATQRHDSNAVFDAAMLQFERNLRRDPWLLRMLESVINLRVLAGNVVQSITSVWSAMRDPLVDAAVADVAELRVSAVLEGLHIAIPVEDLSAEAGPSADLVPEQCFCDDLRMHRRRAAGPAGVDRVLAEMKVRDLEASVCVCQRVMDAAVLDMAEKARDSDTATETTKVDSVDDDDDRVSLTSDSSVSVVTEVADSAWQDEKLEDSIETKAMEEVIQISQLQLNATLSECRIDARRILERGVSAATLADFTTVRTSHAFIEFFRGKSVRVIGELKETVSAVYDVDRDAIIPVTCRGGSYVGPLRDGRYYTCNRLEVWNHAEISGAMQYALDYGKTALRRSDYQITLGVPGAGKTYLAMQFLSPMLKENPNDVLYLGVTKAAVASAVREAVKAGVPGRVAKQRCVTLDSYLCNKKFKVSVLVGDEAPADHIGKFDAAVAISGAKLVKLYGDGNQVEYSPFVAGFVAMHAAPGASVPEENYTFMPETHRCPFDVCAAWVHKYPAFYPCKCHDHGSGARATMSVRTVDSLAAVEFKPDVRYHTYKQDEKEELRAALPFGMDAVTLRRKPVGGLATVHEDQGSTHKSVVTVRVFSEYDKNQSAFNPSLHNKDCYVLSDTTRHTGSYEYVTMCAEQDGVVKAIERSKDAERRKAVEERRGVSNVSLQKLWA